MRSRGAIGVRGLLASPSIREGAGNAGCLLHPRSRVQWCKELRTRAYRYSRSTPASPAQWVDGLCRALPGDEFLLPPSLPARWRNRSGWTEFATDSLTPATGARTTRFCRTLQRRSSCARCSLTAETALRARIAPDAAVSTASRPAFVTTRDPPLLSRRDSAEIATDLGRMNSGIFLRGRLDDPNQPESVQQIGFFLILSLIA
jgi:hypothetical protein